MNKKTHLDSFSALYDFCGGSGKGNAMEKVVVAELIRWSNEHRGATVKSFIELLFDKTPNLPEWTQKSHFFVKRGFDTKSRLAKGYLNDVNFVEAAIKIVELQNVLLSPSTTMRPDFVGVMGKADEQWMFKTLFFRAL